MKDTLVWGVTGGLALLVEFTEADKPGYFRRALFKVIGVVIILEYLINLATFSFWIEFLLQPLLFTVAVAPIIVKEPGLQKSWRRVRFWFSTILLSAITVHTARTLHASWEELDLSLFALQAGWPMLLGLWVLVLVFALAVVSSYEKAFLRLKMYRDENKGLWKTKLGLVMALGIRLRWIHEAAKGGTKDVACAESVSSAYRAAKRYKAELAASRRQEAAYQENLERYAGSSEQDEAGNPRDKREFRESVRALEWLHTCQMGWYKRDPVGYKSDLIELLEDDLTRFGLEKPSGISLGVSDDGERWYAWRRTPGGHYFAIGASEVPPSKWLYDGPEPPNDFPGVGPEWRDSSFSHDQCPNWYP